MASNNESALLCKLNANLKIAVQQGTYTRVKVLVVYWEDGDEAYKTEGRAVRQLFEEVFRYPVEEFAIPTQAQVGYYKLLGKISTELANAQGGPSLLIVHYGGHSDRNDDRHGGEECRSVWAAFDEGDPTLDWYRIQDEMRASNADILLLLDCCYAAQAARDPWRGQGRFEILAAAAMAMKTPSPGPRSFTTTLIRGMREAVARTGFVNISDLHGHLCARQQNLWATPVHITLKSGRAPMCLKPLPPTSEVMSGNNVKAISILQVLVKIREDFSLELSDHLADWLGTGIPQAVSGIEIQKVPQGFR
ncbi:hypothetical protein M406DRAFT_68131 [Cryphonectria parasitica EP155]|uniref:Uncharacterized protein n=1 Tax=Cryphonectria parasitica (strain ATCC 38755 / EP155) TaxID=660469 RepID=A0A9P5CPZ6_CRYP1|nr:uncharacterized protein M406DRAFT_68131 [Cryphonectria parasitica EP155]KAF3765711.1 hypothetical protein M406DRAFT_68131 [Cryphonectria parasitica EP155]